MVKNVTKMRTWFEWVDFDPYKDRIEESKQFKGENDALILPNVLFT